MNASLAPLFAPGSPPAPRFDVSAHLDDLDLRAATAADADDLHALIAAHLAEGRLLPRSSEELAAHAHRFTVAVFGGRVVSCADLAPLSRDTAEIRSLVVERHIRSFGVGALIVSEVARRAAAAGFVTLCAFTHAPSYFVQLGFSIVPHAWLPEKIQADCRTCGLFRHCGQYAVAVPLASAPTACVPLASLHG